MMMSKEIIAILTQEMIRDNSRKTLLRWLKIDNKAIVSPDNTIKEAQIKAMEIEVMRIEEVIDEDIEATDM